MEIRFALEHEFKEIVKCANKFFDKNDGYFETLVPILYKNGINTYKNHIIALKKNMIVGILAYKEILQNDSKYIAIGTVCVDANFRGQGIMNQLFNFLFDNVSNNDGYVLIGNYDLYKRFGFEKSNDSLLHYFEKVNNNFTFKKINYDSDLTKSKKLYESIDYKVNRDNLILNIMMWCNEPYKIYKDDNEIGYLIYNARKNVIDEIVLEDYSIIVNLLESFSYFKDNVVSLRTPIVENQLTKFLKEQRKEISKDKLLIKSNKNIKGIYIRSSDLI